MAKQEADSPPEGIPISRDDLLKYVELDLWSRFRERLWGVLATFLTLITVAGYLGVPYYIRSEMDRRLTEQQATFARRMAEAVTYGELLSMTAVRYHEARFELQKDMALLVGALQTYISSLPPNDAHVQPLGAVLKDLTRAHSLTDYKAAIRSLEVHIPADLANRKITFAGSITQSARTLLGPTSATMPHPVQNGTLLGEIRDFRFRLLELEAYRQALADVESDLSALGAASPSERRQNRLTLSALHDEAFSTRYTEHRAELAKELLADSPLQAWTKANSLYALDAEFSIRDTHP